jgi:hypothetical protein
MPNTDAPLWDWTGWRPEEPEPTPDEADNR